jgi:hypothetical protein
MCPPGRRLRGFSLTGRGISSFRGRNGAKTPEQTDMTSSLAASFRALFPALTAVAALAVLGGAGLLWYLGYGLPAALGLLLVGGIALVACFGLVAIQIENNELLAIIADAVAVAGAPPAAAPVPGPAPAPRAAEPLMLRPAAPAPAPQPAAPRGRVEPVLSARRG